MQPLHTRQKLILLWLSSILVVLSLLGILFAALSSRLYMEHTHHQFQNQYDALLNLLDEKHASLKESGRMLVENEDLIASLNLLVRYQERDNYQPKVFDTEKWQVANQLQHYAQLNGLHSLAIYEGDGQLAALSYGTEDGYNTAIVTYREGRPALIPHTAISSIPFSPITLTPLEAVRKSNVQNYNLASHDGDLFLLEQMPIVLKGNRPDEDTRQLGYLLLSTPVSRNSLRLQLPLDGVTFDYTIEPMPAPYGNEKMTGLTILDDTTPISAETTLVIDGRYRVRFLFSANDSWLTAEMEAFTTSLWIILFAIFLILMPLGTIFIRRSICRPVHDLLERVAALKENNYRFTPHSQHRSDEFGYLLDTFDEMAAAIDRRERDLKKLSSVVEESPVSIIITDTEPRIEYVNHHFTQVTGYSYEEALGMNPNEMASGETSREIYEELWETITKGETWKGRLLNRSKTGAAFWEDTIITPLTDANGTIINFIAIKQDVTDKVAAQRLIEHQALYDELTDLPNRRLLMDRLNQELARANRRRYQGALLFIDLDYFKVINDSLGHLFGDRVIRHVARVLQDNLRQEDTTARLGGDEFIILLSELDSDRGAAFDEAQTIAVKLLEMIAVPFTIEGHTMHLSASAGITLFPGEDSTPGELLKQADIALYKAKEAGRNELHFYHPSMQIVATERLQLEAQLRSALENGELALAYQPQLNYDGTVTGAESLLRWTHPILGPISPEKFIPIAEESGLIYDIGKWLMDTVCRHISSWKSSGLLEPKQRIAINISPKQFNHIDFVNCVTETMHRHNVTGDSLELEITEGMLLHDIDESVEKILALKEQGLHFSIDDFGTGYSSLAYLKELPIDRLKIDKSFINNIATDRSNAAIVDTIIVMTRHLGLGVIAEGVETVEELRLLDTLGCEVYQGYLFSRPLAPEAFERYIVSYRATPPLHPLQQRQPRKPDTPS